MNNELNFRMCFKNNELHEFYEFLSSDMKNDKRITRMKSARYAGAECCLMPGIGSLRSASHTNEESVSCV